MDQFHSVLPNPEELDKLEEVLDPDDMDLVRKQAVAVKTQRQETQVRRDAKKSATTEKTRRQTRVRPPPRILRLRERGLFVRSHRRLRTVLSPKQKCLPR